MIGTIRAADTQTTEQTNKPKQIQTNPNKPKQIQTMQMQMRFREPVPNTNDRTAFYTVSDVLQLMGIRDQHFDSIVLHCSNTGKFEKYAVFLAVKPLPESPPGSPASPVSPESPVSPASPVSPHPQYAMFVYYDAAKSNFWSDGVYREYPFDFRTSAVNAHIANKRFTFYTYLEMKTI